MAGRRTTGLPPVAFVQVPKVKDPVVQQALAALKAAVQELQSLARVTVRSGHGSPEGVMAADIGSLYVDLDGGANATLYVKEAGTSSTGWVAK